MRFWPWKRSKDQSLTQPVKVYRETKEKAVLLFLPGFTGEVESSWLPFIQLVLEIPALKSWNIFGLDYSSNRRIDIGGWERDPDINLLSQYIRTELSIEPLSQYKSIVFVAHSMGGLVLQRALVDDKSLANRTSHLLLFGVPSQGAYAASIFAKLKRQITDMVAGGPFIQKLRHDWSARFGVSPPFQIVAIAGDTDDVVGAESSIEPFPEASQRVVTGNHSTMIRPDSGDHPSVQLLASVLQGSDVPTFIDSARLAVERRDFKEARDRLIPHYSELDDAALITLAMALDGMGEGAESLRILDDVYKGGRLTTPEAAGTLAGRIKRRWLVERKQSDLARATELYAFGLETAEGAGDHDQAYYHAVNLAFLQLMGADATADVKAVTRRMCMRALDHCAKAQLNHWRLATEGEAHLIQGELATAEIKYRQAVAANPSTRELRSMGDQASTIALRSGGETQLRAIQAWFVPIVNA